MKNVKKTDVAGGVVATIPGLHGAVPSPIFIDATNVGAGEQAS